MHYFTYGPAIAAVEDDKQAAKYAAAGWQRVDCDAFVEAWKQRDLAQPAATRPDQPPAALTNWMPNGLYRYKF